MEDSSEITRLIAAHARGDRAALDALFQLVYFELRRMSQRYLRGADAPPSLDSGGLVHELYVRLLQPDDVAWRDRRHFFLAASVAMRHIVIDHLRNRATAKRGGGLDPELLIESRHGNRFDLVEVLALEEALDRLAKISERLRDVVQLRFWAGLSVEETARVLEINARTVRRDWQKARVLLARALRPGS